MQIRNKDNIVLSKWRILIIAVTYKKNTPANRKWDFYVLWKSLRESEWQAVVYKLKF